MSEIHHRYGTGQDTCHALGILTLRINMSLKDVYLFSLITPLGVNAKDGKHKNATNKKCYIGYTRGYQKLRVLFP